MEDHLERDDAAGEVGDGDQGHSVVHLVLEQFHVAADLDAIGRYADAAARPRPLHVLSGGYDSSALCLLHHGAGAEHLVVPAGPEGIRPGPDVGSDQGMSLSDEDLARPKWQRLLLNRFVLVPALLMLGTAGWNGWVATHNHGIVAGR